MDKYSLSSDRRSSSLNRKGFKFAKNKFTELKIKMSKKQQIEKKNSVILDPIDEENRKKLLLDKTKVIVDKEISNDKLLIKIIDNNTIYNQLDDLFYKSGDFDLEKDLVEDENSANSKKGISETSGDFFKKFRKFNENTRKGLLKHMTPTNGFIKATDQYMIVPNPIAFICKNGNPNAIDLK